MPNLLVVLKNLGRERRRAAQEVHRLDEAILALGKLVGRNHAGISRTRTQKSRRRMSPAGRKRIVAAQKARWAKWKARHSKKAA
jgi:hypothetical protein